jgi:hypothetical protein
LHATNEKAQHALWRSIFSFWEVEKDFPFSPLPIKFLRDFQNVLQVPKMFPIAPQFYPIYIDHNTTSKYISCKGMPKGTIFYVFNFVEGNIYRLLCCGMPNDPKKLMMGQSLMWFLLCVFVIFMVLNIGSTYVYVPLYHNIGKISTHVYQLIN